MTALDIPSHAPKIFQLLGHDLRWRMVALLARSDYSGQELVRLLQQPQNLVSYHLKLLAEQHVVQERRNNADERSIYYRVDMETLRLLYQTSGTALHPGLAVCDHHEEEDQETGTFPQTPIRMLFLCTHNSARSQMAEGIVRALTHGQIDVVSAGSHPTQLHPMAVRVLQEMGIDISSQHAKQVKEFAHQSFDYVITVCDRVRESCPTFPGEPISLHWSCPDPVTAEGTEAERYHVFEQVAQDLSTRIRYLLMLIAQESQQRLFSLPKHP
jgi:protein-tyrosine-phosphatase/DNA-binding transcriptional ArsR family regulator